MNRKYEILNIEILKKSIPLLFSIYIFGSYATNQSTKNSDLDIAYLTTEKINTVLRWEIQEDIASLTNLNVDLVDLKEASVVLRAEVVEKGNLIYNVDSFQTNYFEITTYSMYADLNESNIEIVEDCKDKYGRNIDK